MTIRKKPEETDYKGWLTRKEAAAFLSMSFTSLRRLEESAELHPVQENGVWLYEPAELEAFKDSQTQQGSEMVLTASLALVKQSQLHVERLQGHLDNILEPASKLVASALKMMESEAEALRARVEKLEAKNMGMLEASEKALMLIHERALVQARFEDERNVKREAWTAIKDKVMPFLLTKFSGGAQEGPLTEFIAGLTEEQVQILLGSDILDQPQATAFAEMRIQIKKAKENHSNGSEKTPQEA